MPDITFNCPGCKQSLEAPEDMAGDIIECPTCGQQITVPQPAQPKQEGTQRLYIGEEGVIPGPATVGPSAPGESGQALNKCPNCESEMEQGAVLCVKCGFHTKLGKIIKTDIE